MRTEQEMLSMILGTARADDRIRAVYVNGSRVNPEAKKDIFQDYDIAYVVTETESFQMDRGWINRFGERLYMQYPEENDEYPSDVKNCYGWLIQLADGKRPIPCACCFMRPLCLWLSSWGFTSTARKRRQAWAFFTM